MSSSSSLLVVIVAIMVCMVTAHGISDTVSTQNGAVRGVITAKARVFRGIPYGNDTGGAARWTSPVSPPSWSPSVRSALVDGPGCPQFCFGPSWMCPPTTSEDCLTLNVFTPVSGASTNLPVLVWLPGGNFFQGYGGGLLYDATNFVNRSGVIVVTVTYRLGAFGFLWSGADKFNGAYGIQDQRLAMRWVQANIANFGGNPARVTLYGQSAGAGSVGVHLQSAESDPLFAQAILQSNMLTIPFRNTVEALGVGHAFAKLLNCTLDDVICLRGRTTSQAVDAEEAIRKMIELDLSRPLQAFMPWTPVVGAGAAVASEPMDYLRHGTFRKPLIIGSVSQETTLFIYEAFGKPMNKEQYELAVILICRLKNLAAIHRQYPLPSSGDLRPNIADVGDHYIFNCPNRNVTQVLSQKMPVWSYYFDHVMSFSKDGWGPKFPFCDDHVCHGSELPFTFWSYPIANFTGTSDETVLSQSLVDYWSNFAKTGNPNLSSLDDTTVSSSSSLLSWPQYNIGADQTMHFATPNNYVQTGILNSYCNFWDGIGYDLP